MDHIGYFLLLCGLVIAAVVTGVVAHEWCGIRKKDPETK